MAFTYKIDGDVGSASYETAFENGSAAGDAALVVASAKPNVPVVVETFDGDTSLGAYTLVVDEAGFQTSTPVE
jgi:hypothetical protein